MPTRDGPAMSTRLPVATGARTGTPVLKAVREEGGGAAAKGGVTRVEEAPRRCRDRAAVTDVGGGGVVMGVGWRQLRWER